MQVYFFMRGEACPVRLDDNYSFMFRFLNIDTVHIYKYM